MNPAQRFQTLSLALIVTLARFSSPSSLIAPSEPLSFRYDTLIQHDSYWFANIVDRGTTTTVPPISHKMMKYRTWRSFRPTLRSRQLLHYGFELSIYNALLLTAQTAAWGFWSYFFLFCERWNIFASSSVLWRARGHRSSDSILHRSRIFGVGFYDGALWVTVLEQR